MPRVHPNSSRLVLRIVVPIVLAAAVGGCKTLSRSEATDAYASVPPPQTSQDWRRASESWGQRYRANPNDAQAAINYAQALRAVGQRAQATAVLEQASIQHPNNMALLGAYGRALADIGNYQQALEVLKRAHTPEQPDWRVLSVQGAVLDQLGRHDEARRYYTTALKIVPEEPSVLSNLGLSYALSKDLPRAESILRRAAAGPRVDQRVRQNLALVVGLQGRFAEAEDIAKADLPPNEAAANVAYLRQMLSQPNVLRQPGPASTAPTRPRRS